MRNRESKNLKKKEFPLSFNELLPKTNQLANYKTKTLTVHPKTFYVNYSKYKNRISVSTILYNKSTTLQKEASSSGIIKNLFCIEAIAKKPYILIV